MIGSMRIGFIGSLALPNGLNAALVYIMKVDHDEAVQYAVMCLSTAQRQSHVHAYLMDRGLSRDEASRALQEAADHLYQEKERERNKQKKLYRSIGLILFGIGLSTLLYTIWVASPTSVYVVPGGIMGYGLYMFATGDSNPMSGH